jgi:tetratricopeptide (TPR) repeat protein
LLLAGISVAAILQVRRRPYLLVGWLWYLGTLVPVIGLVQVGGQAHADRYTYVPLIGAFVMIAWQVAEIARQGAPLRRLVLAGTSAALIGCVLLAWLQVSTWNDSVTLWAHAIVVTGPNAEAHFNLGAAFREEGKLALAAEQFREAVAINPRSQLFRSNLGLVLFGLGRSEEARAEFMLIIQANPDDANAHFQLGVIASLAGKATEAIACYSRVLALRPADGPAHTNLALEQMKQGEYEAARRHLAEAERCDPRVRGMPAFQAALQAAKAGERDAMKPAWNH